MRSQIWLTLLTLSTALFLVQCLHMRATDASVDKQLALLKKQQGNFESRINVLIQNVTKIEQAVKKSNKTSEKVLILENAIISERQQIFQISKVLIPQFNISQCTCDELTDQERVKILDEVYAAKEQVKELQNLTKSIPPCDELDQIKADLEKEAFFLSSIQSVLFTECKTKVVLSPTIFQSNIYAKNWILGPQTIDDLIDEYYQRSIKYNNVTNCPLARPFFDGSKCIVCPSTNPIFNMYTHKCERCQGDFQVDNDLKKCVPVIHFTNFDSLKNYDMDGATDFPQAPENATACPTGKAYYDGTKCVVCNLPNYWSVGSNQCKVCKSGLIFDTNIKKCVKPLQNKLTVLQNTNWVTNDGNLTRILEKRAQILQKNKTTGEYTYCKTSDPFYDGIQCISCPYEYNIDNRQCTQPPNGTIFNPNTREYITQDDQKESNLKTKAKYINKQEVQDDPNVKNCALDRPWYNGDGCVACLYPYDIFDFEQLKCVSCDADKLYSSSTHQCKNRKRIYVVKNTKRIMATDKVSVEDYKKKILNMIDSNPQALVLECQDSNQQSNFTDCFTCPSNSYLNIETNVCDYCDGRIDERTKKCLYNAYLFTNLDAPNLINVNVDKKEEKARIERFKADHPNARICPISTPYSDNETCIVCNDTKNPLFDYETLECTNCPQLQLYVPKTQSCTDFVYLTNLEAGSKTLLLPENKTLNDLKADQEAIKKTEPTRLCPSNKPYTSDGKSCFACSEPNKLFDAKSRSCFNCPQGSIFNQKLNQCHIVYMLTNPKAKDFIENGKDTLAKLLKDQQKIKQTQSYNICPQSTPYSAGAYCLACKGDLPHFNLTSKACESCPGNKTYIPELLTCKKIIFLSRLDSPNLIEAGNSTISSAKALQQTQKKNNITSLCPSDKPYSDGNSCFSCKNPSPYFNLNTATCQGCQQGTTYIPQFHSCKRVIKLTNTTGIKNYIQTDTATLASLKKDNQNTEKNLVTEICPKQAPFSNGDQCIACSRSAPYFNLQTKVCQACEQDSIYNQKNHTCKPVIKLTNTQAIVKKDYIQTPNVTLDKVVQENQIIFESNPTQTCPQSKPFSNFKECFSCGNDAPYFNLETKQCQNCQDQKAYFRDARRCMKIVQLTNTEAATNYINSGDNTLDSLKKSNQRITLNNPTQVCPRDKPFFNEKECVTCSGNTPYFNLGTKQCQGCKQDQIYDEDLHICRGTHPYTNVTAVRNYIQQDNVTLKNIRAKVNQVKGDLTYYECPVGYPFSDGEYCVKLCDPQSKTPYFNLKTNKCQGCQPGTKYSEDQHICKPILPHYPNLANNNWIVSDGDPGKVLDWTQKLIDVNGSVPCGDGRDFYSGSTKDCYACKKGQFWNYDSFRCQTCNTKVFDVNLHQCAQQIPLGVYQTSLGSPNLIYGGISEAQWEQIYGDNIQKYPKIQDCPKERPYYDGITCVPCPKRFPYFNLKDLLCTVCPSNSTYEDDIHECRTRGGNLVSSDPNPAKMYANIF